MTSEQPKAVVHWGDKYIEIPSSDISLQDVCDTFGLPYQPGVFIRENISRRVTATLPGDSVYHPAPTAESSDHSVHADVEEVILELCTDCNSGIGDAASLDKLDGTSLSVVDVAVQQLVQLGAVELLSGESPQRLETLAMYDVATSPGLLLRMVYPPSVYSPFRMERDPLGSKGGGAANNSRLAAKALEREGGAYRSTLDVYEVREIDDAMNASSFLEPLTESMAQHLWGNEAMAATAPS